MAPLVVSQTNGRTPALGGLFANLSFFLLQKLPSRSAYVEKVQANGGRVVKLEAQADYVVADHLKSACPPGSISYTFIDAALKDGALPDPADHLAGAQKGAIRDVGSMGMPGKSTRTPFTAEDDKVLWQWVERCKANGGMVKGNDIYKQLEAKNGRHTFQAWRDRYIKKLMDRPPAGVEVTVAANAPPSPPTAPDKREEEEVNEEVSEAEEPEQQEVEVEYARSNAMLGDRTTRIRPNGTKRAGMLVGQRRTDFTAEDDKVLWLWVEDAKAKGKSVSGITIYKELAARNPRHSYQSWRQHYLDKVNLERWPPVGVEAAGAASDLQEEEEVSAEMDAADAGQVNEQRSQFEDADFANLLSNANDIRQIDPALAEAAWGQWAEAFPTHTGAEWKRYWEESVWPVYRDSDAYVEDLQAEEEAREAEERRRERKRKARASQAESLDEPGAKRLSKQAVEPEPGLSQTTTRRSISRQSSPDPLQLPSTQPKKIKRESSTPKSTAKTKRKKSKEDFTDLFVVDEEVPLVEPQPQRPKRAVNPDSPIEVLSSDAEAKRKMAAKKKAGAQVEKPKAKKSSPQKTSQRRKSLTPERMSSAVKVGNDEDRLFSQIPQETTYIEDQDDVVIPVSDGYQPDHEDYTAQHDEALPTVEQHQPSLNPLPPSHHVQPRYATQVVDLMSSSAESAPEREVRPNPDRPEDMEWTQPPGFRGEWSNALRDTLVKPNKRKNSTKDKHGPAADLVEQHDQPMAMFDGVEDAQDELSNRPGLDQDDEMQFDPIDDFSLLTSDAHPVHDRPSTRGSAREGWETARQRALPLVDFGLPTSEANRAADRQIRRESLGDTELQSEQDLPEPLSLVVPTSEANRAADTQVRRESGLVSDGVVQRSSPQPRESDVPTSEANRAASQQVVGEATDDFLAELGVGRLSNGARALSQPRSLDPMSSDVDRTVDEDLAGNEEVGRQGNDTTISNGVIDGRGVEDDADDLDGDDSLLYTRDLNDDDLANDETRGNLTLLEDMLASDKPEHEPLEQQWSPNAVRFGNGLDLTMDEQRRKGMWDSEPALEEEPNDITISQHLVEDGEVEDGLPGEEVLEEVVEEGTEEQAMSQIVADRSRNGLVYMTVSESATNESDAEENSLDECMRDLDAAEKALEEKEEEEEEQAMSQTNAGEVRNDPVDMTISDPATDEDEPMDERSRDLEAGGNALTEANLASQQAAHDPPVLRAIDLPEDDEAKDQSDYVDFLQKLMGVKAAAQPTASSRPSDITGRRAVEDLALEPAAIAPSDLAPDDTEYTQHSGFAQREAFQTQVPARSPALAFSPQQNTVDQTTYTHNETRLSAKPSRPSMSSDAGLSFSSQQEIDDALDASLQWPYSPQQPKRQPPAVQDSQDESMQFQTQISYPKLRFQHDEEDAEEMFGTQPPQLEVSYPALPVQEAEADEEDDEEDEMRSQASNQPRTVLEEGDHDMLPEAHELTGNHDEEEANDAYDLDLDIPEPEGGFGLSSSPAKPADAENVIQNGDTTMSDDDDEDEVDGSRITTEGGGEVHDVNDDDQSDESDEFPSSPVPQAVAEASVSQRSLRMTTGEAEAERERAEWEAADDKGDEDQSNHVDLPISSGPVDFSSSLVQQLSPVQHARKEASTVQQSVQAAMIKDEADLERAEWEAEDDDENQIDLGVPEPKSGFYSSPFRPSLAHQSRQDARHQSFSVEPVLEQEGPDVEDLEQEEPEDESIAPEAVMDEVIDISSRGPSSSPYQSSEASSSQAADYHTAKISQLHTQDILNAETQQPDLSMPLPPDSDDDEASQSSFEAQHDASHDLQMPADSYHASGKLPTDPLTASAPPAPPARRPSTSAPPAWSLQPLRPFRKSPSKPTQPRKAIKFSQSQSSEHGDVDEYITRLQLRLKVSEDDVEKALKAASNDPDLAEIILLDQTAGRGFPTDLPGAWSPEEDAVIQSGDARLMKQIAEQHGWPETMKRLEWLDDFKRAADNDE